LWQKKLFHENIVLQDMKEAKMLKNFLFKLVMLCMFCKTYDLLASSSTPFSGTVKAFIFDCDGVLVDTEYLKFLAWQKALASLNIEFSIEEYKVLAGYSSKKIIEMLQEMKGTPIPGEVILLRRVEYQKLQEQGILPIKGMVEFACQLSQYKNTLGIKLGLASSASRNEILFNLKQIGLEQSFDLIISGTDDLNSYADLEGKNKPKPYIYLEVSKRLNIASERCVVFEDTAAGIEAASKAGMIAIAVPNWITNEQDFSKANRIIHSISELSMEAINVLEQIPFKKDENLEKDPNTSAKRCMQSFFEKGGTLKCIPNLLESREYKIQLKLGDAVYPICSGAWCRSQALWAILQPFCDQIILFPPHAARVGWDPYNGQINRYRNDAQEIVPDEFSLFFGIEKALRFGFENDSEWKSIEKSPTEEGLKKISRFYDQYYFGPESAWQGKRGKKRIYIAFSNNVHVTLYRLDQCNENLKDVTVIAIESDDLITYPPTVLNMKSRSTQAYEYFTYLLRKVFDLTKLDHPSSLMPESSLSIES
jgi:beta-phosphoglucomutase